MSVLSFSGGQCFVVCFVVGRLRAADTNRINRLIRLALSSLILRRRRQRRYSSCEHHGQQLVYPFMSFRMSTVPLRPGHTRVFCGQIN